MLIWGPVLGSPGVRGSLEAWDPANGLQILDTCLNVLIYKMGLDSLLSFPGCGDCIREGPLPTAPSCPAAGSSKRSPYPTRCTAGRSIPPPAGPGTADQASASWRQVHTISKVRTESCRAGLGRCHFLSQSPEKLQSGRADREPLRGIHTLPEDAQH